MADSGDPRMWLLFGGLSALLSVDFSGPKWTSEQPPDGSIRKFPFENGLTQWPTQVVHLRALSNLIPGSAVLLIVK